MASVYMLAEYAAELRRHREAAPAVASRAPVYGELPLFPYTENVSFSVHAERPFFLRLRRMSLLSVYGEYPFFPLTETYAFLP